MLQFPLQSEDLPALLRSVTYEYSKNYFISENYFLSDPRLGKSRKQRDTIIQVYLKANNTIYY